MRNRRGCEPQKGESQYMKILEKGLVGLAPRRIAAGYTQQAFADELGIESRSLIAMYETGKAWPRASILPAMADLLGCTIDELYERPEDEGEARATARVAPTDPIIPAREA